MRNLDPKAALAGLQLLPENAAQLSRLQSAVATVAARSKAAPSDAAELGERLRQIEAGPQPPLPGLHCVELVIPRGRFRALPGFGEDEYWVVEVLLGLIERNSSLSEDLVAEMSELGQAVLGLSEAMAERAGVERNSEPEHRVNEETLIPNPIELGSLEASVRFGDQDLTAIAGAAWSALLKPLIVDAGALTDLDAQQREVQLTSSPLLADPAGGVIVVAPTALLTALRHQLILAAIRRGEREHLVECFHLEAARATIDSLGRLGIVNGGKPDPDPDPEFDRLEMPMLLDFDKELHLIVIADDLEDYDEGDPMAVWQSGPSGETLEKRLRAVTETAFLGESSPNEVLHLIVAQGMGRPTERVVDHAEEMGDLRLVFSASELEVIARVDKADPILLWDFANDASEIRGMLQIAPTSQLEEWSYWRQNGRSFTQLALTVPDREMVVALIGHGRLMRIELGLKQDPHGARLPTGAYIRVLDYLEDRVPISQADAAPVGSAHLIVESLPLDLWVMPFDDVTAGEVATYLLWTELVAYWLWQLGPSLDRLLAPLQGSEPIVIRLQLDALEKGESRRVAIARPNQVLVEFPAEAIDELDGEGNDGEREIMQDILTGLAVLGAPAGQEGVEAFADKGTEEAIALHMSPPSKRKLLPIVDVDPGYEPLDFPERFVSEASRMRLRREVGMEAGKKRNLKPGKVAAEEVQPLLNDAVAALFQRLESLAASLDPAMLIEWVISLNERLIHEQTLIPGQLAVAISAFGPDSAYSQRRANTAAGLAGSSVASRFLIEYLAARPPQGIRPISYSVYDRMLATAELIVGFGTSSDLAKEGLAEISAVLLPTGELVDDRGEFGSGIAQYHELSLSGESLRAGNWAGEQFTVRAEREREEAEDLDPSRLFAEIDPAMEAESGHKLSELFHALVKLGEVESFGAERVSGGASRLRRSKAIEMLAEEFNWTPEKCRSVIDEFTIGPRARFTDHPPGFERRDLWPWRFNRRLSYLRRPLIESADPENADDPYLVFGRRQLYMTTLYIESLISHGTFEASSKEMRNYMAHAQQRESRLFNGDVANAYEGGTRKVVPNLRKVGGKRLCDADGNDLGDVDVMVADFYSRTLLCVEAKRLAGALAPHQLRNQIDRTFGEGSKKPSHARKHQNRVQRVSELKREVLAELQIHDDAAKWKVSGVIVTDMEALGAFVSQAPLPVKSLDEVRKSLAAGALF